MRITVTRAHAPWIDQARKYKILVDDVERAVVGDGQAVTIDVPGDTCRVRCKIDWCGSRELLVSGEDVRLHCAPGASAFTAIWYILFRRDSYIALTLG